MAKKEQHFINEYRLDEYLEYWMDKLNLKHWDIEARIVRYQELGEGRIGRNRYDWQAMESRIELIHPDDFEDWNPYDMEFILVHELLHLIIDVQYPVVKGRREIFSEQAINQIAHSFIAMDRDLKNAADVTDKLVRMVQEQETEPKKKKKNKRKG